MTSSQPTVLIIGSSGRTGYPVSTAILDSGRFNVVLLCRPGSEEKPQVKELIQKGAELRVGDIIEGSVKELEELLAGVNILVIMVPSILSTSPGFYKAQEKILLAASKSKDIQRVAPSEFGIIYSEDNSTVKNSLVLQSRLKTRSLVRELKLPYTYINVGWWMDIIIPTPSERHLHWFIGAGNVKTAVTSKTDIGRFVARIIDDPRALNAQVFCYGDEVSLNEIYDTAERISGKDMRYLRTIFTDEECLNRVKVTRELHRVSPSETHIRGGTHYEACYITFVDGENTSVMAKELGYLDARDLYPDFRAHTFEDFAKEFYKEKPEVI